MKTVLVAGVRPNAGTTLVLNGLTTYWQQYRQSQQIGSMMIPSLTPETSENGEDPNLAELWRSLQTQQDTDLLCLSSNGSLASPVTSDTTLATLAKEWRIPVLLVAPVEWEAIAPTVATIALARDAKVTLAGIILHQHRPESNIAAAAMEELLQSLTHSSILGTIPFLDDPSDEYKLANIASTLMLDVLIDQLER